MAETIVFGEQALLEGAALFLVFARIGSAFVTLPLFAEGAVNARARLSLALLVSFLLAPVIEPLDALPSDEAFAIALLAEILFGLAIGLMVRLALLSMHVAGSLISFQSGLASAQLFDPSSASTGSLPGNMLTAAAVAALFLADAHHLFLRGLAASYAIQPAGAPLPHADLASLVTERSAATIEAGVEIAAPILGASVAFFLAMGLANKLMPQFQVFFVAMPAQIALAFAVFALASGSMLLVLMDEIETALLWLDAPNG